MNKNGVIITLAVFMLGMALLGLTQSINQNSRASEDNKKYETIIDRVSTKHENIENNIVDIILNTSGLVYNATDTNITFTETLPNENVGLTALSILRYKEFVEQHKDALDINIASGTVDLSTITILPYDINYSHSQVPGRGNKFNNSVYYMSVSPNDINAYILDITIQNQPYQDIVIDDADCCLNASCTSCSSGIKLTVIVRNSAKISLGQKFYCGIWGTGHQYDSCTLRVDTGGNPKKDIYIYLDPPSADLNAYTFTVINNNTVPIGITTGIDFGANAPYPPYIGLPQGLIAVGDGKLSAEKR